MWRLRLKRILVWGMPVTLLAIVSMATWHSTIETKHGSLRSSTQALRLSSAVAPVQEPTEQPKQWTLQKVERSTAHRSVVSKLTDNRKPEVRHVGFLKVHKAASSTVQNIFFRFGEKRNLTFAFTNQDNYFSRSYRIHLPLVPPRKRPGNQYDIICTHGIFNVHVYSQLLPPDTSYVAIVREPLSQFISSVKYYTTVDTSLNYLQRIIGDIPLALIRNARFYDPQILSYTRNSMARDFGFESVRHYRLRSVATITRKLESLDKTFKLVMVVEYFDESLVLMKRLLNWSLQDIMYLPSNVNQDYNTTSLSEEDLQLFKERNFLDYHVFNYFNKTFWSRMGDQSSDIWEEIGYFKQVLKNVSNFCLNVTIGEQREEMLDRETFPSSPWSEQFHVTRSNCDNMQLSELKFIKRLRAVQGSDLRAGVTYSIPSIKASKMEENVSANKGGEALPPALLALLKSKRSSASAPETVISGPG